MILSIIKFLKSIFLFETKNQKRRRLYRQSIHTRRRQYRQSIHTRRTAARPVYNDYIVHEYKAVCGYCGQMFFGDTIPTMLKAIRCEKRHEQMAQESLES